MSKANPKVLALVSRLTGPQLEKSKQFLIQKRNHIYSYSSIEDLAVDLVERPAPELSGFDHHFIKVRNTILRTLWSEGVLIGPSVIENLLFNALIDKTIDDPIGDVFDGIHHFGLHCPGFVLYPLHSFGVKGQGLLGFLTGRRLSFIDARAGIAITPQTNTKERLVEFLENATKTLKMSKALPHPSIEHYLRGGVLKWLISNPLLLVKCRTFTGEYYENQFLLTIKLKLSTTLITMLHSLQKVDDTDRLYSTSTMNNFETLDIKHYVVFESAPNRARRFNARRVPMNLRSAELSEISELNVELNPVEWRRRPKLFARLSDSLQILEKNYMTFCIGAPIRTPSARVYRKTFMALDYFRLSFRSSSKSEDGIVNLAIAFETLLTDSYSPNQAARISGRVRRLLKGIPGTRKLVAATSELSILRNESVHTGVANREPDWQRCRLAFIYSFLGLVKRYPLLSRIPAETGSPIGDIVDC